MKKFFAVTVVGLSLAFGFTSCSDDDDSSSGEDIEEQNCLTCTITNISNLTENIEGFERVTDIQELVSNFLGSTSIEDGEGTAQVICEGENGNAFIGDQDQGESFMDYIDSFELFGDCNE